MRILFLTRFDFTEDKKDGGLLASDRNCKMLKNLYGEENIILCILTSKNKENRDNIFYFKADSNLVKTYLDYLIFKDRISCSVEKELISFISKQDVDLIFYDGSTFGQIIINKIIKDINSIVFCHNIERQYTWEQVKKHSWLCIFRYMSTRYNELKMVKYGKKIICLNDRDNILLQQFYGRRADYILPITFDDTLVDSSEEKDSCGSQLLYVGSYFAHNYTGLIWFIEQVMPHVNAKLVIIGKNMEKLKEKVNVPLNVQIDGTVDSLEEYYLSADAIVMPIFMGGGMKVKTAEALMYGKAIFASKEALEGYDVVGVENIFECNTKEQFIQQINNYFAIDNRKTIYNNVRELFLNKYCTKNYLKSLKKFIEEPVYTKS